MDNDPVAADIARHIAAILHNRSQLTDAGGMSFRASSNGDLIHLTTAQEGRIDAWVLTVEWDGERDHPANNAPQEAP
jgi:hypothetical protein